MRKWILSAALLWTLGWGGSAAATNGMFSFWQSYYTTTTDDAGCRVCHRSAGDPWNAYGWAIRQNLGSGFETALLAVEGLDSDLDPAGYTNLQEILANTQPGWTPGPNNTIYFADLSTLTNQDPPDQLSGLRLDPVQCSDLIDNDGDGATDFGSDPECASEDDDLELCGIGPELALVLSSLLWLHRRRHQD